MRADSLRKLETRSQTWNTFALGGVVAILMFVLGWQMYFDELPCPLCLLQRVAFLLVGIGFLLNVRFGSSPLHYSIILVSAIGGMVVSARQVLLHVAPGDPGYGQMFFGLHFYTWSLGCFTAVLIYCAIMITLDRGLEKSSTEVSISLVGTCLMWAFLMLVLLNFTSTLLICGISSCPENPIHYLWSVGSI